MNWRILALLTVIGAFLAVFLVLPVVVTVRSAFLDQTGSLTPAYVLEVFRNPLYVEGLLNALKIAVGSTTIAFLFAWPLVWLNRRFDFWGRSGFVLVLISSLLLPPFVGAIGFRQILGQEGALNAFLRALGFLGKNQVIDWLGTGRAYGVMLMNALHLYPILFVSLAASLAQVDSSLLEAAENLGCRGLRCLWRVTLPLILPGIFAGGSIVFIWSFTELGVPLMFDYYRVTSVQIFDGVSDIESNPITYALVAVTLALTGLLYFVARILLGSPPAVIPVRGGRARNPISLKGVRGACCSAFFLLVCCISLLPHFSVICLSFSRDWYGSILPHRLTLDHYGVALANRLTVPAIQNSLLYASLSTCIDLFLGIAIAYLVTRTRIAGRSWLDSFAMLPLAVPGIVLAIGYLAITRRGSILSFLDPVRNPLLLLVIAYSVRRLPYLVRAAAAGFQQAGIVLEEAAQNLGATPFRALARITLPLIGGQLFSAALLAFSFAMLEVSDSLILAQRQSDYPVAKAIYELSNILGEGPFLAAALGVWAMIFLGLVTGVARTLAVRVEAGVGLE